MEQKDNTRIDIRKERLDKARLLKKTGFNPYANKTNIDITIQEFNKNFDTLNKNEEKHIGGRIIAKRGHGALIFIDIYDGTGRIQALLRKDEVGNDKHELFLETIDTGDFIEVTGVPFITKRGAKSILLKNWNILTKTLIPLPKEYFGIKDEDDRYRKRYLDILLNEDVSKIPVLRSKFWNTIRSFLLEREYIEVQTPILENTTGGAEATPFVTHHNALDIDVYLRISPELWHKRLMVAGVPKVFEIGRIFRNEGMSSEHLQDYTQVEFYEAYLNFDNGKKMLQDLYRKIAKDVFNTSTFKIKGFDIDFNKEWKEYNLIEIIRERFNIDPLSTTKEMVQKKLLEEKIKFDPKTTEIGRGIDLLWKSIRKEFPGPGFLVGIPKYLEPLAKPTIDNPEIVERLQIIIAGSEIGKAFNELNDPLDQRERFEEQQRQRDAGDEEAQMNDDTFIEALEYGMPPTFGFGVSERLFSFLMDKNIRETTLFPLMKPKKKSDN